MEGYIGQVILFAGNFAPRSWAFCQGQLLPISQNTALFSIIGTMYGGDGRTTFALPDLRGRVAIGPGQGPGLSNYSIGQKGGSESVTLTVNEIPAHTHSVSPLAKNGGGDDTNPGGNKWMATASTDLYAESTNTNMGASPSTPTGGGGAHNNIQPYLAISYVICLQGIFPSRN